MKGGVEVACCLDGGRLYVNAYYLGPEQAGKAGLVLVEGSAAEVATLLLAGFGLALGKPSGAGGGGGGGTEQESGDGQQELPF